MTRCAEDGPCASGSLEDLAEFDFAYDRKKAAGKVVADPMFLGVFDWNDKEDDAES